MFTHVHGLLRRDQRRAGAGNGTHPHQLHHAFFHALPQPQPARLGLQRYGLFARWRGAQRRYDIALQGQGIHALQQMIQIGQHLRHIQRWRGAEFCQVLHHGLMRRNQPGLTLCGQALLGFSQRQQQRLHIAR